MVVVAKSIEAFYAIRNLHPAQWEVLRVIKEQGPISDSQIAEFLTKQKGRLHGVNKVTPRRGELLKDNLIRMAGDRINENNRREDTWEAVP